LENAVFSTEVEVLSFAHMLLLLFRKVSQRIEFSENIFFFKKWEEKGKG